MLSGDSVDPVKSFNPERMICTGCHTMEFKILMWAIWKEKEYVFGFCIFLHILLNFVFYTTRLLPSNCLVSRRLKKFPYIFAIYIQIYLYIFAIWYFLFCHTEFGFLKISDITCWFTIGFGKENDIQCTKNHSSKII